MSNNNEKRVPPSAHPSQSKIGVQKQYSSDSQSNSMSMTSHGRLMANGKKQIKTIPMRSPNSFNRGAALQIKAVSNSDGK